MKEGGEEGGGLVPTSVLQTLLLELPLGQPRAHVVRVYEWPVQWHPHLPAPRAFT